MNNEEAITILEELTRCCNYEVDINSKDVEALNKAIKVLKNERPHGKWIDRNGNTWCSECRNDTIYIEGDRPLRTDFCPNCGADMREGRQ